MQEALKESQSHTNAPEGVVRWAMTGISAVHPANSVHELGSEPAAHSDEAPPVRKAGLRCCRTRRKNHFGSVQELTKLLVCFDGPVTLTG